MKWWTWHRLDFSFLGLQLTEIVPRNPSKRVGRRGRVFNNLDQRNYCFNNQLVFDTISLDLRNDEDKLGI